MKHYHEIYRERVPEHCVKIINFGRHVAGLHEVAKAALATDPSNRKLLDTIKAASSALKSYQYGNSSTELAEEIAKQCDAVLAESSQSEANPGS